MSVFIRRCLEKFHLPVGIGYRALRDCRRWPRGCHYCRRRGPLQELHNPAGNFLAFVVLHEMVGIVDRERTFGVRYFRFEPQRVRLTEDGVFGTPKK